MVQVRDIDSKEMPPENGDWVLVEKVGEKFTANGSVSGNMSATFFAPPAFDSIEEAIGASKSWAAENDVPVVYIRSSN